MTYNSRTSAQCPLARRLDRVHLGIAVRSREIGKYRMRVEHAASRETYADMMVVGVGTRAWRRERVEFLNELLDTETDAERREIIEAELVRVLEQFNDPEFPACYRG